MACDADGIHTGRRCSATVAGIDLAKIVCSLSQGERNHANGHKRKHDQSTSKKMRFDAKTNLFLHSDLFLLIPDFLICRKIISFQTPIHWSKRLEQCQFFFRNSSYLSSGNSGVRRCLDACTGVTACTFGVPRSFGLNCGRSVWRGRRIRYRRKTREFYPASSR